MTNGKSPGGGKLPLFLRWVCRSGPALLLVGALAKTYEANAVDRIIFYPIGALTAGAGTHSSRTRPGRPIAEWKTGSSLVVGIGPFMLQEAAAEYTPETLNRELHELGCQVLVPLGWDLGDDQFSFPKLAGHLDLPVIVANLRGNSGAVSWAVNIRPWVVITSGATRVLISGVIHRKSGLWLLPRQIQDFLLVDEDLALVDYAAALEKVPADLKVLLLERDLRRYGGDYGSLADLLRVVPFFDLVVGLHGSRFVDGREAGGGLFIQPGAGNAVSISLRVARPGGVSVLGVSRMPLGRRSRPKSLAEVRRLMKEMLRATGSEVALYPDPDLLPLSACFAPGGLVDGSRLCRMRVPYSHLRQLLRDRSLQKGVLWYSEKFPIFNTFERKRGGRKVTVHPRRKISVCTTMRMAASCGGRFLWLRRLALDPHYELEPTDIRPRQLLANAAAESLTGADETE